MASGANSGLAQDTEKPLLSQPLSLHDYTILYDSNPAKPLLSVRGYFIVPSALDPERRNFRLCDETLRRIDWTKARPDRTGECPQGGTGPLNLPLKDFANRALGETVYRPDGTPLGQITEVLYNIDGLLSGYVVATASDGPLTGVTVLSAGATQVTANNAGDLQFVNLPFIHKEDAGPVTRWATDYQNVKDSWRTLAPELMDLKKLQLINPAFDPAVKNVVIDQF